MRFAIAPFLVGLLFLSSFAPLKRFALAADQVVEGEIGQRIDDVVQPRSEDFWGVIGVSRRGKTVYLKAFGMADYVDSPMAVDSLFEIASVTKPFTAAAILKLETDKKLSVDDPVSKFFRFTPPDKKAMKIRHLLNHTSGISGETGLPYAATQTREQMARYVLSQPLASRVGEKFEYCNFGYALLAAIVEIASGKSYEDFLRDKIFKPAGMKDTGFIGDKALDAKRAVARICDSRPGSTALDWYWGWGYRGMGGIVSTAADMLAFDRALAGAAVLDDAAKEKMHDPAGQGYALGWQVGMTASGGMKAFHSGSVAGFVNNYVRCVDDGFCIVALSNGKADVMGICSAIESALLGSGNLTLEIDVAGLPMNQYKAVLLEEGSEWTVEADGESLTLRLKDTKSGKKCAALRMPHGPARKTAFDIERLSANRRPGQEKGMKAGLYLRPYVLDEGKASFDRGIQIEFWPCYRGQDEKGNVFVDDRVTMILVDSGTGNWAVMAIMDDSTCRKLVADIRAALK